MKRRTLYVLAALVLVLAVAVSYMMLIKPVRASISQRSTQIEEQSKTLAQAQAKLARLDQSRKDAEKNSGRLIELSKMLPGTDQLPSLLLQVQDVAAQSGIEVLSISPSKGTTSGGFGVVTLTLTFNGTFFDVNDFIYRLEQLAAGPGRLMAIANVSLGLGEDARANTSPSLTVSMTVQAFTSASSTGQTQ